MAPRYFFTFLRCLRREFGYSVMVVLPFLLILFTWVEIFCEPVWDSLPLFAFPSCLGRDLIFPVVNLSTFSAIPSHLGRVLIFHVMGFSTFFVFFSRLGRDFIFPTVNFSTFSTIPSCLDRNVKHSH